MLINNAGVSVDSVRGDYWNNPVRYWEPDTDTYRRFYEINVQAPIHLTLLVTPEMRARKWGRIVTTSTSLNTMIRGGMAPYGSSKAAMEAFTASVAADLRDTGVTANVVAPGGPADTAWLSPIFRARIDPCGLFGRRCRVAVLEPVGWRHGTPLSGREIR